MKTFTNRKKLISFISGYVVKSVSENIQDILRICGGFRIQARFAALTDGWL